LVGSFKLAGPAVLRPAQIPSKVNLRPAQILFGALSIRPDSSFIPHRDPQGDGPGMAKRSKSVRALPPRPAVIGDNSGRPAPLATFLRDNSAGTLSGFRVAMREPADDYRLAWYDATSRTIDALHNSGWLAGGVNLATDAICGPNMALNARPDPTIFGEKQAGAKLAAEWARNVERRFEAWGRSAYACDIYARQNLGQQCSQSVKAWFGTGEIAGVVRFKKKPGNTHGTKIMLLPSKRIPQSSRTNPRSVQGVVLDTDGAPVRIIFETFDPVNPGVVTEIEVPVRDPEGRPQTIHIHDSPPTVVRGITPLAPAIRVVRQFDQLFNATLTTALIHALFAATVESSAPTEEIFAALQGEEESATPDNPVVTGGTFGLGGNFSRLMGLRAAWYRNTKLDLGVVGKLVHLFPGEKLEFKSSTTPNANFKDFTRFLLREIAKCLGITYEQLTGDREGATYSSERMGGAEAWLTTLYRRTHIAGRFMQIAYEAWLEEDIELYETSGGTLGTPFPGGLAAFLANRDAASRSDWRGPPKPTADDLKTAKANEVKKANGVLTREAWCAEEGTDWQDVDDQRLREQENEKDLKINPPAPSPTGQPGSGNVTPQGRAGGSPKAENDRLVDALMIEDDKLRDRKVDEALGVSSEEPDGDD
jgi:lambda family phage portal protein